MNRWQQAMNLALVMSCVLSSSPAARADICKSADVKQLLADEKAKPAYTQCQIADMVKLFSSSGRDLIDQHNLLASAPVPAGTGTAVVPYTPSQAMLDDLTKLNDQLDALEAIDLAAQEKIAAARETVSLTYEIIARLITPFSAKSQTDFPQNELAFCGMMLAWKKSKLWSERLSECPSEPPAVPPQ